MVSQEIGNVKILITLDAIYWEWNKGSMVRPKLLFRYQGFSKYNKRFFQFFKFTLLKIYIVAYGKNVESRKFLINFPV